MKENTKIKILAFCVIISICFNIFGAVYIITGKYWAVEDWIVEDEKETQDDSYTNSETTQIIPVFLNVQYTDKIFYFIDNKELKSRFDIDYDYLSNDHTFIFSLNPRNEYINGSIAENIEKIEKYFSNIHIKSGITYWLLKNDEFYTNLFSTYCVHGFNGYQFSNVLYLEIKDIDDFFIDDTFKIYLFEPELENDYISADKFSIRFLNLEKIKLLHWDIPDDYYIYTDRDQLIVNWEQIVTERTNGWHYILAIMKHETDPWRDYPIELWFNPITYKTVIKEVGV